MKISKCILLIFLFNSFVGCSQTASKKLLYIDEVKPLYEPKIFAKDFISKSDVYEYGSVFNGDGTEFFFAIDSGNKAYMQFTTLKDNKWTEPVTIITDEEYSFNDPFLSPDEQRLYYISNKPKTDSEGKSDYDIWYSKREGNKWSAPINAGSAINSDGDEYYISFNEAGTMYFGTNKENMESRGRDFDIHTSQNIDGVFQKSVRMSDSINTNDYEADVFIYPDESYIIFCAQRESGLGRGDLYISFKNDDGSWTNSVNMGNKINTKGHELCPFVTKDKQYLFYTSNQDIYWVSTKVIDDIKEAIKK